MSNRYAPVPNIRSDSTEMDAAFDDGDDGDDETHPLNPLVSPHRSTVRIPGTYDFENVDYDYPPPGSPPRPSAIALPNEYGNSNGLIPSFNPDSAPSAHRGNWFTRSAAAVLPSHVAQRLGWQRPLGVVGGGTNNDGVFANVTAKPTRPIRIQEGDSTYVVPEDARAEAPPSYNAAQADSVPPYWETTVHAPFAPDSMSAGELFIDSLPTGSLFSFLWNMLVSISFQFVGFLLTYLLHTTHAARLGSRAGLGVTLIQYGFALRGKIESDQQGGTGTADAWSGWRVGDGTPATAIPTGDDSGAASRVRTLGNIGMANMTMGLADEQTNRLVADATTEWLSFFLMTVGWFILLTSLLGFWRVKRWERGILASQQTSNAGQSETGRPTARAFVSQIERAFGRTSGFFREGFGLSRGGPGPSDHVHDELELEEDVEDRIRRAEEGTREAEEEAEGEEDSMIRVPGVNSSVLMRERRLQDDLRAAGFL